MNIKSFILSFSTDSNDYIESVAKFVAKKDYAECYAKVLVRFDDSSIQINVVANLV